MSDMSRQSRGREGPRTQTKEAYCRSADGKDDGVDECPCEQAKHLSPLASPQPDPILQNLCFRQRVPCCSHCQQLFPFHTALAALLGPPPLTRAQMQAAAESNHAIPAARGITKFSNAEQWAEGPRTCWWGCRTGQEVSMPRRSSKINAQICVDSVGLPSSNGLYSFDIATYS